MILNLSQPMTVVPIRGAGQEYTAAAADPVEMDPAGLSLESRVTGERRFYPWSSIAYIVQGQVSTDG